MVQEELAALVGRWAQRIADDPDRVPASSSVCFLVVSRPEHCYLAIWDEFHDEQFVQTMARWADDPDLDLSFGDVRDLVRTFSPRNSHTSVSRRSGA